MIDLVPPTPIQCYTYENRTLRKGMNEFIVRTFDGYKTSSV
jgi:hypothetical protein